MISISEVRMSPDLKIATAFVTPLGVPDHADVIEALNSNAKFIRGRLGPQLRQMKYMPEVRFRDDTELRQLQARSTSSCARPKSARPRSRLPTKKKRRARCPNRANPRAARFRAG